MAQLKLCNPDYAESLKARVKANYPEWPFLGDELMGQVLALTAWKHSGDSLCDDCFDQILDQLKKERSACNVFTQ